MNNNQTEITLLVTNESGVLSSVMMTCGKLGLFLFKNHTDKVNEESSRLTVVFNGKLNCSKEELVNTLEGLPKILLVESSSLDSVSNATPSTSVPKPALTPEPSKVVSNSLSQLQAIDMISPEAISLAEEKLLDLLGPVASMLVSSAQDETKHIGDMFMLLAKELDGDERQDFLSLVNGLH